MQPAQFRDVQICGHAPKTAHLTGSRGHAVALLRRCGVLPRVNYRAAPSGLRIAARLGLWLTGRRSRTRRVIWRARLDFMASARRMRCDADARLARMRGGTRGRVGAGREYPRQIPRSRREAGLACGWSHGLEHSRSVLCCLTPIAWSSLHCTFRRPGGSRSRPGASLDRALLPGRARVRSCLWGAPCSRRERRPAWSRG